MWIWKSAFSCVPLNFCTELSQNTEMPWLSCSKRLKKAGGKRNKENLLETVGIDYCDQTDILCHFMSEKNRSLTRFLSACECSNLTIVGISVIFSSVVTSLLRWFFIGHVGLYHTLNWSRWGKQQILSRKTSRFEGNKIYCFVSDQSLSDFLY